MPVVFFPLEGAQASAVATRSAMAASVVHLYQTTLGTPTPSTPTSDFTTNEADYSGYAALTLTTWNAAGFAPGSGYMITSPLVQFAVDTADPQVPNVIGGAYILDSTGKNRIVMVFDQPVPMQVVGQILPLNFVWLFPTQ